MVSRTCKRDSLEVRVNRDRGAGAPVSRPVLDNHVKTMVSIDFFTVPTIRFQVLYVFLVLAHDRSSQSFIWSHIRRGSGSAGMNARLRPGREAITFRAAHSDGSASRRVI